MHQTEIPIFKVPSSITFTHMKKKEIATKQGIYMLTYPDVTKTDMDYVIEKIQWSKNTYLSTLTVAEIVTIIDQAVQKWLNPDYPLRKLAELLLPVITGYDEEMIRLELKRYMRNFRKKELLRFLDEEFDQAAMLDEFRPRKSGGMSRAYGPDLIFHVFSGNVPGVQIWSLIMGLLVKSANIGKTTFSEPLMAVLFAQSLAEVDEKFADAIAILPWKGGTVELEEPVIEKAKAVVVYGSNAAVESYRTRVPQHKIFLKFGHKISFALIGQEALTPDYCFDTIHRLAEDVSVYDQQSCLAPQCIFVEEGGVLSSKQVAQMLAAEMERYHKKRPRAKISDEEAMAIQGERTRFEFAAMADEQTVVYSSSSDTSWTVIYHENLGFFGSPLNRTIHVFRCQMLEEAFPFISQYEQYLQSCGVALNPNRLMELASSLGAIGVNRICSIGEMNRAKAGWHHDGRFNLIDLVRFTDIEQSAEQYAEKYDPDVE